LSGRGLCDELITCPEESYRLCCVVCDPETSRICTPYMYDISTLRVNNQTLFCCSKFPWARKRISPYFIDNFGTRFKKVRHEDRGSTAPWLWLTAAAWCAYVWVGIAVLPLAVPTAGSCTTFSACTPDVCPSVPHRGCITVTRALWGKLLGCWDCGFEFPRGHACLSVVNVVSCQIQVFATGLIPCPEQPYRVCVCTTECD
jgi:hypothetical protein